MYKGQGVTVVIPTKNELENLKRLLPTIPSFIDEVLVVDGYSNDGTAEFANRYKGFNAKSAWERICSMPRSSNGKS